MQAAQNFLSALQIRYDDCQNQQQVNNKAGAVYASIKAERSGTYLSPSTLTLPQLFDSGTGKPLDMEKLVNDPHSGDNPAVADAMFVAVEAYHQTIPRGNLQSVYIAINMVNALRPVTKEPIIAPPSDLEILSCAGGVLGVVASMWRNGEIPLNTDGSLMSQQQVDEIVAYAMSVDDPRNLQPTKY